jgi:hypothetical protein
MHLSGYYMLAPWSDVCIIVRLLHQLGFILEVILVRSVLVGLVKKFGDKFDRVPEQWCIVEFCTYLLIK